MYDCAASPEVSLHFINHCARRPLRPLFFVIQRIHLKKELFYLRIIWETVRISYWCSARMYIVMFVEIQTQHMRTKASCQLCSTVAERWYIFVCDFAVIESTVNCSYQVIPETNVRTYVWQLQLGWSWLMQQYSYPKHNSKSTSEWWIKKTSQSPQINPLCIN